jgi:hypothetical protein
MASTKANYEILEAGIRSPAYLPDSNGAPIRLYGDKLPGRENELSKTMRITLDDPCQKMIESALKKYDLNDKWSNYSLFIVHNGRGRFYLMQFMCLERPIDYTDKPLSMFQKLQQAGEQPMFVLRHNRNVKQRAPARLAGAHSNTSMQAMVDSEFAVPNPPVPPRRTSSLFVAAPLSKNDVSTTPLDPSPPDSNPTNANSGGLLDEIMDTFRRTQVP